jgi:hypothetical protein
LTFARCFGSGSFPLASSPVTKVSKFASRVVRKAVENELVNEAPFLRMSTQPRMTARSVARRARP